MAFSHPYGALKNGFERFMPRHVTLLHNNHRNMEDFRKHISINPNIRFGKPCIVGTRISVDDILNWLASGTSSKRILKDFPQLKREHIHAAQAFVAAEQQPPAKRIEDNNLNEPGMTAFLLTGSLGLYE